MRSVKASFCSFFTCEQNLPRLHTWEVVLFASGAFAEFGEDLAGNFL